MHSVGGGVCLGERDSGGSEVGLGDVLGQQGVLVIMHKDCMGIRDSGSGGGGVCPSCLRQMGAMQSLASVAFTV